MTNVIELDRKEKGSEMNNKEEVRELFRDEIFRHKNEMNRIAGLLTLSEGKGLVKDVAEISSSVCESAIDPFLSTEEDPRLSLSTDDFCHVSKELYDAIRFFSSFFRIWNEFLEERKDFEEIKRLYNELMNGGDKE
jgi:hypothetical protein